MDLLKVHARPQLNGDTETTFHAASTEVYTMAALLKRRLEELRGECFHGRNYQHLDEDAANLARRIDIERLERCVASTEDVTRLAVSIGGAAQP